MSTGSGFGKRRKSMPKTFYTPGGLEGAYLGSDFAAGMQPVFFYFSLSAQESLTLSPFNTPTEYFKDAAVRVISYTIPGHEEGRDKHKAMAYWAENLSCIEDFLSEVAASIDFLIDQQIIDPHRMAVGGLSRGGFLATHLAAREKRISTVLGFSPITRLSAVDAFQGKETGAFDLENLIDKLTPKNLRFYIGNHDTQVGTDSCFFFIHALAKTLHAKRARNCHVELFIKQSIGLHGHGTAPQTFEEGSKWVKTHL